MGNNFTTTASSGPAISTSTGAAGNLLTYADAVDHLVDYLGGADDDREQRKIRRAAQMAYRDLLQIHQWTYYLRKTRIRFNEPYAQGTCEYVHSTRILTVSDNTDNLPTWAANGEVEIAGVIHEVDSREGNTTLKLSAVNNPGADVAAGTAYTLFQSQYLLPEDFTSMLRPVDENNGFFNAYVPPELWFGMERASRATGKPFLWTILGDSGPYRYGRHNLAVWPRPTSAVTRDFLYRHRARRMRRSGFETNSYTGTVAGTAGTNPTLTFTSATLEANMAGAVIRITDDTTNPPDGEGSTRPYLEQFVLASVNTGAGTAVISGEMLNTYSGAKFRITDPVDIDPELNDAFYRGCEYQLATLNRDDKSVVTLQRDMYYAAVRLAMENDLRHPLNADVIYDAGNPLESGAYTISL